MCEKKRLRSSTSGGLDFDTNFKIFEKVKEIRFENSSIREFQIFEMNVWNLDANNMPKLFEYYIRLILK